MQLPEEIKHSIQGWINIQNKDNECFSATCSLTKNYDILKIQISKNITVKCNFFLITA